VPYETTISPYRKAVVWDYNTVFNASSDAKCYQLSDQQIQALLSTLTAMMWRTRWTDAPEDMREILDFVGELANALMNPVQCGTTPPSSSGNGDLGGGSFDDLCNLIMELDVKFSLNGQLYEPAIPLVPCSCGDGSGTESDINSPQFPGTTLPGATPGESFGDITTLCDVMKSGVPWILDAVDDAVGLIATVAWTIDTAGIVFDEVLVPWINDVRLEASAIQDNLVDPDFVQLVEDKAAIFFSDPLQQGVTRRQLFNFANKIPFAFEGSSMKAAFILWSLGVNVVEDFNNAIPTWAGTGNYAECEAVEARIGRTFYNPSNNAPILEDEYILESGGTTYTLRVIPIADAYNRTSLGGSPVPYDYIGTEVVGAGVVITDLVDLAGNATELRLTYNDADVVWWTAPNDMTAISQYHVAAWNNANVIVAVREELQQRAVNRVGLSVDDTLNTTKITPSSRADTFNVGAADIDTYSGTVAFVWIVSTDN